MIRLLPVLEEIGGVASGQVCPWYRRFLPLVWKEMEDICLDDCPELAPESVNYHKISEMI
jgi:hypothetical protein